MRIAIVTFELDPHSGGMGNWCWQFACALAHRGCEVHIVAQHISASPLPARIVRHVIPGHATRVAFANAASQYIDRLDVDVVHDMGAGWRCDVFQPHGGSHFAWLARRTDMFPAWVRMLKRPIDALLPRQRDFLRHARRQFGPHDSREKTFVALSKFVADDFVRLHGVRPEQVAVVPNGVDCRRFSPANRIAHRSTMRWRLGIHDETLVLFLAAHNFRLKGVPELMKIAGRLVAYGRDMHVVIAGGKRVRRWRSAATRAGLAGRATFVGPVADMAPYYAAADAYVHPTYYDPCSLVLLEAAASGLPIVTTRRCNGAAELFREGQEILTAREPRDTQALVDHIEALTDSRLRDHLGGAARRVALRHSFERNVSDIMRIYECRGGRRAAA